MSHSSILHPPKNPILNRFNGKRYFLTVNYFCWQFYHKCWERYEMGFCHLSNKFTDIPNANQELVNRCSLFWSPLFKKDVHGLSFSNILLINISISKFAVKLFWKNHDLLKLYWLTTVQKQFSSSSA